MGSAMGVQVLELAVREKEVQVLASDLREALVEMLGLRVGLAEVGLELEPVW
jgi:hypothetical protein